MSKFFDAIQKSRNDVTEMVASALSTDTSQENAGPVEISMETILTALPLNEAAATATVAAPPPVAVVAPSAKLAPALTEEPARRMDDRSAAAQGLRRREPDHVRTIPLRVGAGSPLLPFDTANWRASEQYRTIRTRILQHSLQPRIIAVSSAGSGDGKSVTAINTAGALSLKSGADILLLDADFRRSNIDQALSTPRSPGLSDILLRRCSLESALVRAEQFPNLYILPVGEPVDNPSDLLESAEWAELRAEILRSFQYTIVDCPPIGTVSEWDLIHTACEGIIVVGRQDHTKLQEFLKAIESVSGPKMIGVVMNCTADWFLQQSPASYYDYRMPR